MSAVDYRMTNFDRVAFIGGLYVGTSTNEVQVFNSAGNFVGGISPTHVSLQNGTAAAPALSFGGGTGGASTGFYAVGANNPAIAVGGALVQDWSGSTTTDTVSNLYARNTSNALIGTVSVYQSTAGDPGTLRLDLLAAATKNAYIQFRETASSNVFALGCDAGGATLQIKKSSPTGSAIISITQAGAISLKNGTASLPSIAFGLGTGGVASGFYAATTNSPAISSNGTQGFRMSATQSLTLGSDNSTTHILIGGESTSTGSSLNCKVATTDAAGSFSITRFGNDGLLTICGGGSSQGAGALTTYYGPTHATKASVTEFTNNSTLSGSISAANLWTIGTGTSTQHALNTLLATNGAQVATITNLPAAATVGNPAVWFKITINGTTSYIPAWH